MAVLSSVNQSVMQPVNLSASGRLQQRQQRQQEPVQQPPNSASEIPRVLLLRLRLPLLRHSRSGTHRPPPKTPVLQRRLEGLEVPSSNSSSSQLRVATSLVDSEHLLRIITTMLELVDRWASRSARRTRIRISSSSNSSSLH